MNSDSHQLLFVTGAPAGCSPNLVRDYFRGFGNIGAVTCRPTSTSSLAFMVEVLDPETRWRIIGQKVHAFFGRTLQVQQFVDGVQKLMQVAHRNKRRVIAKRIPFAITLEQLQDWLELEFGAVESVYAFSSDSKGPYDWPCDKRYRSYSILFKGKSAARQLLELKNYHFPKSGKPCIFEKFKPQKQLNVQQTKAITFESMYNFSSLSQESTDNQLVAEKQNCLSSSRDCYSPGQPEAQFFKRLMSFAKPTSRRYFSEGQILSEDTHFSGNYKFHRCGTYSRAQHGLTKTRKYYSLF